MPGRPRSRRPGCRSSGRPAGSAAGSPSGRRSRPTLEVERELADILLTEFVPTWRVREGLADHLPDGWRLVDLYDVWLGSPALAGQVAAADYRIEVDRRGRVAPWRQPRRPPGARASSRANAQKGGSTVRYDLRPLLADVGVVERRAAGRVRARTRFDPVLGTGRPEEVVAALGDAVGTPLVVDARSSASG